MEADEAVASAVALVAADLEADEAVALVAPVPVVSEEVRAALIIVARVLATVIIIARAFLAGGDPVIIMAVAAVALAA